MYTEEIKIALFGNTFVGKTHLFTKLDWERLPKVIHSNIGVEFGKKNVNSKITKQSIQSFGILTVGQERYKQISLNHIKKGQGIYLVYGYYMKGDLQQFKILDK